MWAFYSWNSSVLRCSLTYDTHVAVLSRDCSKQYGQPTLQNSFDHIRIGKTSGKAPTDLSIDVLPLITAANALMQRSHAGLHIASEYAIQVDLFATTTNDLVTQLWQQHTWHTHHAVWCRAAQCACCSHTIWQDSSNNVRVCVPNTHCIITITYRSVSSS